jgi:hypothetical protein
MKPEMNRKAKGGAEAEVRALFTFRAGKEAGGQ